MIGKGQRGNKGERVPCASSWCVLPPALPLTPSVLPPHTHPEEHSHDGTYGSFSHLLFPFQVCVCVLRVFLCVSVLEKADLRELCSTFTLLLIHPFALTVFARLDRMGGETKRFRRDGVVELNSADFFLL